MSKNQTPNTFVHSDIVAASVVQGQVECTSKSAKAVHRKTIKNAERSTTDITHLGDHDSIPKRMQTLGKPRKSRNKAGRVDNLEVSDKSLSAEVEATNAVPLPSESFTPSQPLLRSKATLVHQEAYPYNADSTLPLVCATPVNHVSQVWTTLTAEATNNPPHPDDSVIVEQHLDNLLEMIRPQRQALLTGPQISIRIGNTSVTGIYKRSAMAASPLLHNYFIKHPKSLIYRIHSSRIHPGAVYLLLVEWMRKTCNEFEAHAVPAQKSFEDDIAVLCAARFLRMHWYCSHIRAEYVAYLRAWLPSYEEIALIEKNASNKDPLWTTMVNHLSYERFRGLIPDPEEFEQFLKEHTRLKNAMEAADAITARKTKQHVHSGEAKRHEPKIQEKRTAATPKKKLDNTDPSLIAGTADKAEILHGPAYAPESSRAFCAETMLI